MKEKAILSFGFEARQLRFPQVAALFREATRASLEDWREVQVSMTQDEMYTILQVDSARLFFLSQLLWCC